MGKHQAIQRSRIAIATDGRVIITDNWLGYDLSQSLSAGFPDSSAGPPREKIKLELNNSRPSQSLETPIGLIDFGMLLGEEPWISGSTGTGAFYIHGCPLRCTTCYQPEFFASTARLYTDEGSLVEMMLKFQNAGAKTISMIVAVFNKHVLTAIKAAKTQGLVIPVIYNYSGLITPKNLEQLIGVVDHFLPDMKAVSLELVEWHGLNRTYPRLASEGIRFLLEQGQAVTVRHLLTLPFSAYETEVELIIDRLGLASGQATLSLLTEYYDPNSRSMLRVSDESLKRIRSSAERSGAIVYDQRYGRSPSRI